MTKNKKKYVRASDGKLYIVPVDYVRPVRREPTPEELKEANRPRTIPAGFDPVI